MKDNLKNFQKIINCSGFKDCVCYSCPDAKTCKGDQVLDSAYETFKQQS